MLADSKAFSGFSVDDLDKAQAFYGDTLGLPVDRADEMQILRIRFAGDRHVIVYAKPDHQPATFTVLNFPVQRHRRRRRGACRPRRHLRALRGLRAGREGRDARRRPAHRVVQGPGGQHPVGA